MVLLQLGQGKAKNGTILERMDSQKLIELATPVLAALTPAQRQLPRYRRLRRAYALAISYHLPRTQARPHLSAVFRTDLDLDSFSDQRWRETFILTKPEFLDLHEWLSPIISEVDVDDGTLTHAKLANCMLPAPKTGPATRVNPRSGAARPRVRSLTGRKRGKQTRGYTPVCVRRFAMFFTWICFSSRILFWHASRVIRGRRSGGARAWQMLATS